MTNLVVKSTGAPAATPANVVRPPAPIPATAQSAGARRVAAVQRTLTQYGYGQLKPTGAVGVGYPGRDREIRARAQAPGDRPDVRSAGARTLGDDRPPDRLASVLSLAYRLPMRLKSSIWVAAYLRRCQTEGIFGAVRKRGAEEAGAVFVKVALLDGNAMLYAPAPQTVYDESRPAERLFAPASPQPVPEQSVEERLAKELRFDPDAWIVETEDRAGRHFLDLAKA